MLEKDDVVVYIPTYNDIDALRRNLEKLDEMGLRALVVDGRFTDFPQINGSDYSTDGTREYVEQSQHYYATINPCREEDKLNGAFKLAHDFEYKCVILIGSDAYLEGDIDEFMINLSIQSERYVAGSTILQMECEETQPNALWNNTGTRQPRIYLGFENLEARHLHWVMYEKGAPDDEPKPSEGIVVHGLKIVHDNSIRPQERDDMMTEYQNSNVPRERKMFKTKVLKKAHKNIKIMVYPLHGSTYEHARKLFLEGHYSHLLLLKNDLQEMHASVPKRFVASIEERNNVLEDIPILTAAWDAGDGRITLDPEEKYQDGLPDYPKVKELYSKKGTEPTAKYMVVPWTLGPIVCMSYAVVRMLDHIGDEMDFLKFRNQLDFKTQVITDITI